MSGQRRHSGFAIAWMAMAAILLSGCEDGGPADTEAPGVGGIHGTVTSDDAPRPGLTVTLSQGGMALQVAQTDGRGKFTFNGLEPGEYTVSIAEGAVWPCSRQRFAAVLAGQDITLTFACRSALFVGVVSGRVTVNGFGGPGFILSLMDGERRIRTTVTERDGTYVFRDVAVGDKSVSLVATPNMNCSTNLQNVTVPEGGSITADFACTGQVLVGRVTLDGNPVWSLKVQVIRCETIEGGTDQEPWEDCQFPYPLGSWTGSEGRYVFTDLSPGEYEVFGEWSPIAGLTCPELDPVTIGIGMTASVDISCSDPNPWDY